MIAETLLELEQRFGAISSESQIIHGMWASEGQTYRDELVRVFVDVADSRVHRQFFQRWKKRLKARFKQLEIRMTTYLVEEICVLPAVVQKLMLPVLTWCELAR